MRQSNSIGFYLEKVGNSQKLPLSSQMILAKNFSARERTPGLKGEILVLAQDGLTLFTRKHPIRPIFLFHVSKVYCSSSSGIVD